MRLAIIQNTVVSNVVAVDDDTRAETIGYWTGRGFVCIESEDAAPGDAYIGGKFVSEVDTPALDLDIKADKTVAAIGETINITAQLRVHGTSQIAPVDPTFAVPVEDADGAVAMIKGVRFDNGIAGVALTFAKSGYFRITDAGINRRLPEGQKIGLPQAFEVTVFE